MGSPAAGHEDLVREYGELVEERDRFTRQSLVDIFECFSSINNARQVIGEGLVKSARLISMSEQIQSDLNTSHLERTSWLPYQNKLQHQQELSVKETLQRKKIINAKVLKMLRTPIKSDTALRLVSHLKEQTGDGGQIPAESLPLIFLQCREVFITDYILSNDPAGCEPAEGFRRVCLIMKQAVLPVLEQYYCCFSEIPPISAMICRKFTWFIDFVLEVAERSTSLKSIARYWDALVGLDDLFSVYNTSFFPLITEILLKKAVRLAVQSIDKAVALFIGSLGKTVIPDGASMRSVPAFIMLVNSMDQMFKAIAFFCPPQFIAPFESAVQDKLLPIEQALRPEHMSRIRDLFETEFRPYLTDTFARLIELSK